MINGTRKGIGWVMATVLAGAVLVVAGGCENTTNSPPAVPSAQTPEQAPGAPGQGQQVFASDDEALKALLSAVKAQNHDQVHQILGPAWKELVSGDKVEDGNAFKEFAQHAAEHTRLQKKDATTSIIYVGKDDWPFPIPIAETPDGKWFFDTEAGKTEILARRIGANELDTIEVCRAYVQAQRQYAGKDRDGSGVLKYAQRILSTPGKMDGLYWSVNPGQEQSPFGPLMAGAEMEGYAQTAGHPHEPYHGYHFRVLKQQGSAAPGGKYNYVINGNMIAGFALVAFPAEYESSGIMTFIVSHQGNVYQKDLGPNTKETARKMTKYNPDDSWTLVKD
ncbi:MAG: DUF2950 domain-containing protein [Tepidisphaeraceae bacterium]|jgi:hypothetical protein